MATKRLYRSRKERMVGGVCGGIAEYFNWDVSLIRFALLLFVLAAGTGLLAYLVAWIVIPENPGQKPVATSEKENGIEGVIEEVKTALESSDAPRRSQKLFGLLLLFLGIYFFLQQFFPWLRLQTLWPLLIVVVGIGIILKRD